MEEGGKKIASIIFRLLSNIVNLLILLDLQLGLVFITIFCKFNFFY